MDVKLDNSVSSALIKGKSYNVLTFEQYRNSEPLWDSSNIAVIEEKDGDKYILPYRGKYIEKSNLQPGVYSDGSIDFEVFPKGSEEKNYKNIPIITISSNDDIETILKKEDVLSKLAQPWITNPDNITYIPIKDTDKPALKGLKQALNDKRCDMDKYEDKFGDNYPNDKRQLKNDDVTLKIINRYCENMDMEAILTIRDREPGVPNPLGHSVSVSLLTGEFLNIDLDNDESSDEEDDY